MRIIAFENDIKIYHGENLLSFIARLLESSQNCRKIFELFAKKIKAFELGIHDRGLL